MNEAINMEKIIDKVAKLFALSESSNEHEAESALLKAQEYLAKYNLSMQDVDKSRREKENIDNPVNDFFTGTTYKKAQWKGTLAYILAENFKCYAYNKVGSGTNRLYFMGRKQDVYICNLAFDYAVKAIMEAVTKIRVGYVRCGRSVAGIENAYARGFISGLKNKFEEQKRKNQEWGLVLVKDNDVIAAFKNLHCKAKKSTQQRIEHSDVYAKGHEAGTRFGIADRITG